MDLFESRASTLGRLRRTLGPPPSTHHPAYHPAPGRPLTVTPCTPVKRIPADALRPRQRAAITKSSFRARSGGTPGRISCNASSMSMRCAAPAAVDGCASSPPSPRPTWPGASSPAWPCPRVHHPLHQTSRASSQGSRRTAMMRTRPEGRHLVGLRIRPECPTRVGYRRLTTLHRCPAPHFPSNATQPRHGRGVSGERLRSDHVTRTRSSTTPC